MILVDRLTRVSHKPQRVPFSDFYRQELYNIAFDPVSRVVESLLDRECKLSADARMALRSTLSNAHHFAAVLLPLFYDAETLDLLCKDKQSTDATHSEFARRLDASSSYPLFKSSWTEIRSQKKQLRKITKLINGEKFWKKVRLHRVWDDKKDGSLKGKQVVLNPKYPRRYPTKMYHKMYSSKSYIVGDAPEDGPVEYHLFVTDCPLTDDELKSLLNRRSGKNEENGDTFIEERWFVGVHVVNLGRIRQLKKWMDEVATPSLKDSVTKLRPIRRAKTREDPKVRARKGSRMYGTGVAPDQQGHVRRPRNFNVRKMEEKAKFDLMQANDHILDGVVAVKSSFSPINANIRLQKHSSHGCLSTGRKRQPATVPCHRVFSHFSLLMRNE